MPKGMIFNYGYNLMQYLMPFSFDNTWQQSREPGYSFNLLCAGIELQQPQLRFEFSRMVFDLKMKSHPTSIDSACRSEAISLKGFKPELVDQNDKLNYFALKGLAKVRNDPFYHFLDLFKDEFWKYLDQKVMSHFVNVLMYKDEFEKYCKARHRG